MGSCRFARLGLLSVLCASVCAAAAQIALNNGVQQQSSSAPRTIAGVVLNSVTGRPISRALVQAGTHAMLTDGEGRFAFDDVTENGMVTANKPGYFPENDGAIPFFSATQSKEDSLELRLVPEAVLSGHVTDAQGNPIEGVAVTFLVLAVQGGLRHWEQRTSAVTNAEGEFRVADLQAGHYRIYTALKLDGPPEGEAAAGYAPATYPETGANGAGALEVHAGDQLQAEISTRLEKLYPVSGIVTALPANTWLSFTVRTQDGGELNPSVRQNPQAGEFHLLLPSGSFELRAQAYGQPPPRRSNVPQIIAPPEQFLARQAVQVAQRPVSGLRMTLEPLAALPIEVDSQTTAKPQAAGPSGITSSQVYLNLLSADPDTGPAAYGAERTGPAQQVQDNGPLIIRNLPPGQYFLQGQGPPPWHIASAVCGGVDLTREPLAISGSAAGCTVRVVMRDDVASFKISVSPATPGQTVPAFIYVLPLNNLTRDVQMFSAGSDGQVALDAIAPGQYLLLATRQATQFAFRDAESLHRYEAEGTRVDLSPGANGDVHLDLIAGEP